MTSEPKSCKNFHDPVLQIIIEKNWSCDLKMCFHMTNESNIELLSVNKIYVSLGFQ